MAQFDYYEIRGVIVPGAMLALGLVLLYPDAAFVLAQPDVSLGELGIFLTLAFVAGHLLQALGNVVEQIYWRAWGGWPTDWPRSGKHKLLAPSQQALLVSRIRSKLGLNIDEVSQCSEADWASITRQAYSAIDKSGHARRIDAFTSSYGLFRGLLVALLSLAGLAVLQDGIAALQVVAALVTLAGLAAYRMHHFSVLYARELYSKFLQD